MFSLFLFIFSNIFLIKLDFYIISFSIIILTFILKNSLLICSFLFLFKSNLLNYFSNKSMLFNFLLLWLNPRLLLNESDFCNLIFSNTESNFLVKVLQFSLYLYLYISFFIFFPLASSIFVSLFFANNSGLFIFRLYFLIILPVILIAIILFILSEYLI